MQLAKEVPRESVEFRIFRELRAAEAVRGDSARVSPTYGIDRTKYSSVVFLLIRINCYRVERVERDEHRFGNVSALKKKTINSNIKSRCPRCYIFSLKNYSFLISTLVTRLYAVGFVVKGFVACVQEANISGSVKALRDNAFPTAN